MSLESIYRRKVVADQAAAAEVNTGVYHAWADLWHVAHKRGEPCDYTIEVLLFNPDKNLSNAANDDRTLSALVNIAQCNEVYKTRIHLCQVPYELMVSRPKWHVLHVDGGTLCAYCDHNMQHQFEAFQGLSPEARLGFRESMRKLFPWCEVDDRGLCVLR